MGYLVLVAAATQLLCAKVYILQNALKMARVTHMRNEQFFNSGKYRKKTARGYFFFQFPLPKFLEGTTKSINNWDVSFKVKPQNECDFHVFLCGVGHCLSFSCVLSENFLFFASNVFFPSQVMI